MFGFHGQGLLQLGELGLAFVLSALVGLEREVRQKAAGLRTYTLVGVSAALFMLVSKYGFDSVLENGRVMLDPSRVAAQVVSGIGFIGGGVIFMRRNVVRGLTTAASVWLTAALGMACGGGLGLLAVAATAGHFLVMLAFPPLVARFLRQGRRTSTRLRIVYEDRSGLLGGILLACSALRFAIDHVEVERDNPLLPDERDDPAETRPPRPGAVSLVLTVRGRKPATELVVRLMAVDGVLRAATMDEGDLD